MESARRLLRRGESHSTFAVPARRKDRRLAAKEGAAANDRSADHRCVYAEMLAARDEAGPFLARALARRRMKLVASELQQPPTSMARTTSRARAALANSGYVLSLARRACCKQPLQCVQQRAVGRVLLCGQLILAGHLPSLLLRLRLAASSASQPPRAAPVAGGAARRKMAHSHP